MMQQVLCVLWREANGKQKRKKGKSKHCNLVKMSVGIYHSKMKDILRIAYQIDNVPTYAKQMDKIKHHKSSSSVLSDLNQVGNLINFQI